MKRLLYITDQEEYTDHGAIGPLFHGFLKNHMDVNIVYFTRFKDSFQLKGDDFIVPMKFQGELFCYLEAKGIDINVYDFVFVRNLYDVLKKVLDARSQYRYKVGFRVSVPRTTQVYEAQKLANQGGLISELKKSFANYKTNKLINQCDLFMPMSLRMKDLFYPDVTTKMHILPPGLDPNRIQPYKHTTGEDITFIYIGTVDKLQHFEVILQACQRLERSNWRLHISTFNPDYVRQLILEVPDIAERIKLMHATNLDELMEQIHSCDVGIGLLPNLNLHAAVLPAKVLDYYTCSMPSLITDNARNREIFDDGENAFFCQYDVESIAKKMDEVMELSLDEIAAIGEAGQKKLLQLERNYEIMAKRLYEDLETL